MLRYPIFFGSTVTWTLPVSAFRRQGLVTSFTLRADTTCVQTKGVRISIGFLRINCFEICKTIDTEDYGRSVRQIPAELCRSE